jgi:hypothetical protein
MAVLPAEFSDLEQFADWSLRTEAERYNKRLNSKMEEMQTFYDVAFPRLKAGMEYLDQFDLKNLPEHATLLLWLFYSLVNVTFRTRSGGSSACPTAARRPWTASSRQLPDRDRASSEPRPP